MKLTNYIDLISRQKSKELVLRLYENTRGCKEYSLKDEIVRTAIGVMNNIAEGFETQDKKLFKQANSKLITVNSMAYILLELGVFELEEFRGIEDNIRHTQKMIGAYSKII